MVNGLKLDNNQSASSCLGKFLSLLPHLTYLKIDSCCLHDDFYKEIADRASSSQVKCFFFFLKQNKKTRDGKCFLFSEFVG